MHIGKPSIMDAEARFFGGKKENMALICTLYGLLSPARVCLSVL